MSDISRRIARHLITEAQAVSNSRKTKQHRSKRNPDDVLTNREAKRLERDLYNKAYEEVADKWPKNKDFNERFDGGVEDRYQEHLDKALKGSHSHLRQYFYPKN